MVETIYKVNGVEYTDKKEAEAAAKKLELEAAKKAEVAEARKADVKEVQDAANAYLELVAENNKKRDELTAAENEALAKYRELLNAFDEKHKGYHLTYTRNNGNVEFKVEEVKTKTLEEYMNEQRERTRKFFEYFGF